MSKYLIHASQKRIWYVNEYLIPSMLEQGIKEEDISIHNDTKMRGSRKTYIESFKALPEEGFTWHLQDDILISPNFKEMTEIEDRDVICTFCCELYDGKDFWYSFPCIGISNRVAKEFVDWMENSMQFNPVYRELWESGKAIDWYFKQYVKMNRNIKVKNLIPNIVDHIDYLIGGSTIREKPRLVPAKSKYWKHPELIEKLKLNLIKNMTKE